jgi:NAD(P)-dependent dehydrogenase (short-subunit alcohol dehydrogenase family)
MTVPSARRSAACWSSSGTGQSIGEVDKEVRANPSVTRVVDPADIAALAVCLASDQARSIVGETFPINGDSPSSGS